MEEDFIGPHRQSLSDAINQNIDTNEAVMALMNVNIPLKNKFKVLDFAGLLKTNSQSIESLKDLLTAFNILEKYGRHLLKPPESRSNMWRHIKYKNVIFRDRVDKIKGGRMIMREMGYTVNKPDGVAFPDNTEPDHAHILNLLVDIVQGKKELENYLQRTHTYPELIESCLTPEFVSLLTDKESYQETESTETLRQPVPPNGIHGNKPASSSRTTVKLLSTPVFQYQNSTLQNETPIIVTQQMPQPNVLQQMPPSIQQLMPSQQLQISNQDLEATPKTYTALGKQAAEGPEVPMESETDTTIPSIVCDICGNKDAEVVCKLCDNKQLCRACNEKWHKHPKRLNHVLEKLRHVTELPSGNVGSLMFQTLPQLQQCNTNYERKSILQPAALYPDQRIQSRPESTTVYQLMQHTLPRNQTTGYLPSYDNRCLQGPGTPNQYNTGIYGAPQSLMSPLGHASNLPPSNVSDQVYNQQSMLANNCCGIVGPIIYGVQHPHPHMFQGPIGQFYPVPTPPYTHNTHIDYPKQDEAASDNIAPIALSSDILDTRLPHLSKSASSNYLERIAANDHGGTMHPSASYPNKMKQLVLQEKPELESSESKLLANIMLIPDPCVRLSRASVDHMTLQDDLNLFEQKMNKIMLKDPNFYDDDTYKKLSRKKRKHLKELHVLEKFIKEQQDEKDVQKMDEINQGTPETLIKNLQNMKSTDTRNSVIDMVPQLAGYNNPSLFISSIPFPAPRPVLETTRPSGLETARPSGLVPTGPPIDNQVRSDYMLSVKKLPSHSDISENPLRLSSSNDNYNDLPSDIKAMLVLDQNPHAPRQKLSAPGNSSQTHMTNLQENQYDVTFPPNLSETQNKQNQMDKDHNQVKLENKLEIFLEKNTSPAINLKVKPGSNPNADMAHSQAGLQMWHCQHCTYLNEPSAKACFVCSKTSDKRKVIVGSHLNLVHDINGTSDEQYEACEYCTFKNLQGTTVCSMCNSALARRSKNKVQLDDVKMSVQEMAGGGGDMTKCAESSYGGAVGKIIDDDQDEIYHMKKEAQRKYVNDQSQGSSQTNIASSQPTKPNLITSPSEGAQVKKESSPKQLTSNINVGRVRTLSDQQPANVSSVNSNSSAPTSMELSHEQFDKPEVKDTHGLTKGPKNPQLNFTEAIEQINLRREQEQMSLDGHDIVYLLKGAEKTGFELNELLIAMKMCVKDNMKPIEWLNLKWPELVGEVVTMVTKLGNSQEQNDIGDLSNKEAKQVLIDNDGNKDKAFQACVKDRKSKYIEISSCSQFPREVILTALYQNCGNVEDAIDQLNNSVTQGFSDRLWETRLHAESFGDLALAAATRSDDQNSSICNSPVSEAEFRSLVMDTKIDRERRIRMVFVEGKIKSWGRAETVISILDTDMTGSEEPLQCTLEDIIEAVRNCGNRKASLIYLKQECQICYNLFPMSKIQNLSSCNCKLCIHCIKQNFEVSIREKHVRNWCCPLCNCPGIENEEAATAYFEFLSLMLRVLVSPDVMELYDTKLRDWHLQKDPNFRWCAHCASGFIWDRPDVLGMTCNTCRKKTCFMCKKEWEDQHEGLTCEQFTQWKIDNDPEKQAKGVQLYLEDNGIDCPSCKMRYSLAKGGCMHFKCPQCGYEFCSGCSQAFVQANVCKVLRSCANKGLHCHHPRDCFYYLRDNDIGDLKKLLKDNRTDFNTDIPPTQEDKNHCLIMEQKEDGAQKRDEPCGRDTVKGMAGLCEMHYKEYLVGLINKRKIDPVAVMSLQDLKTLIKRHEVEPPKQLEPEERYKRKLVQFVKDSWPLLR